MKKICIGFLLGLVLAVSLSFSIRSEQTKPFTAEVVQIQSLYIFTDAKPLRPYKVLGKVGTTIVWDSQYEPMRNHLIKRTKKKFPEADGLILQLKQTGLDQGIAIKFE